MITEQYIETLGWENLKIKGVPTFKRVIGLQKLEDGDWCVGILILRLRIINNISYISISQFDEHDPDCKILKEDIRKEQIFRGKIEKERELKKLFKQLEI